jgi:hypothetical protein
MIKPYLHEYDVRYITSYIIQQLQSKKYFFSAFASFDIIIITLLLLLLLFISSSPFHNTFAASPAFDLQGLIDKRSDWVQTYGNDSTHLKSDYTNLLETDYFSEL